jgi:hypothetical protein
MELILWKNSLRILSINVDLKLHNLNIIAKIVLNNTIYCSSSGKSPALLTLSN